MDVSRLIINKQRFLLTVDRLCYELIENHGNFEDTCLIGIQDRGALLSDFLMERLKKLNKKMVPRYGKLDITFYRDDVRDELHVGSTTDIPFSIEEKKVILIDDVLYTGRTIRAALDAIQDFGRPRKVELCVLVDRRFNRELPIQPDYCGKAIDTVISQKVKVEWDKEAVVLY